MILTKHGIIDLSAPRHLFKYQAIYDKSLENLKNKILWASHPTAFNDPFELQFSQDGDNPEKDELDSFIRDSRNFKLVCFSTNPLDILMWSHYGNNHTGMCLGFYNHMLTYPVNYSDDFPHVDFTTRDKNQREIEIFKVLITKSSHWSYEKERRIMLIPDTDSKVNYPGELFMVAFGLNASQEQIAEVKSIVTDPDVLFYKCRFVPNKYGLDFDPA